MYCVKCGVELPNEAKFCVGCGKAVDELPSVPLADESKTEITGGSTTQNALPKANLGGSLLQGRTPQIAGGALAILLLIGAAYWYLVERNMIREPVYKVGDTWTVLFPATRLPDDAATMSAEWLEIAKRALRAPSESSKTVIRVGGKGDIEVKDSAFPKWPYILWQANAGAEEADKTSYLRFPLVPGKTWQILSSKHLSPDGFYRIQTDYRVGEWETVTALAGSFRSLPVEITRTEIMSWRSWNGRTFDLVRHNTEWYSPEVKQMVKSVDNKTGRLDWELKSYSVK